MVLHHLPQSMREPAIREMQRVLKSGGRLIVVDLQRPTSLRAAFSLITLLHGSSPENAEMLNIEPLLNELRFTKIARHSLSLGAIGAVVATLE